MPESADFSTENGGKQAVRHKSHAADEKTEKKIFDNFTVIHRMCGNLRQKAVENPVQKNVKNRGCEKPVEIHTTLWMAKAACRAA
ncbi:MAG: hypothetical protein IJO51_02595 [Clostridia bacterium]|nr:hypothetical protein [Clostridia bacterium]MBQ9924889.1 hypothetical protein [Clostridia bacterium]